MWRISLFSSVMAADSDYQWDLSANMDALKIDHSEFTEPEFRPKPTPEEVEQYAKLSFETIQHIYKEFKPKLVEWLDSYTSSSAEKLGAFDDGPSVNWWLKVAAIEIKTVLPIILLQECIREKLILSPARLQEYKARIGAPEAERVANKIYPTNASSRLIPWEYLLLPHKKESIMRIPPPAASYLIEKAITIRDSLQEEDLSKLTPYEGEKLEELKAHLDKIAHNSFPWGFFAEENTVMTDNDSDEFVDVDFEPTEHIQCQTPDTTVDKGQYEQIRDADETHSS